jgi:hypothetical protein
MPQSGECFLLKDNIWRMLPSEIKIFPNKEIFSMNRKKYIEVENVSH